MHNILILPLGVIQFKLQWKKMRRAAAQDHGYRFLHCKTNATASEKLYDATQAEMLLDVMFSHVHRLLSLLSYVSFDVSPK